MNVLIVLDVGTSNVRGVLFNNKGDILLKKSYSNPPLFLKQDIVEQDPQSWVTIVIDILKYLIKEINECKYNLVGISITGQRSSLICLDQNGDPTANAIMWQDKRAITIIDKLKDNNESIFEKTGSNLNPVYLAPKISWVKFNDKDNDKRIYHYLSIVDYIAYVLTGEIKTDLTYASRTLLLNLGMKSWDDELLNLFQIERDKLSELIEPGEVIGEVTGGIAREIGLNGIVPLISSGGDQQCGAVGTGVINEGKVQLNLGTGGYLITIIDKPPNIDKRNLTINYFSVPNKYMMETSLLNCASLINWFTANFYEEEGKDTIYRQIEKDLLSSSPGSNGVILQPYFQGRGTPDWNSDIKGSFLNLTLSSKKADLLHAVIEGIGLELRSHMDILKENMRMNPEIIYLSGGLSNSEIISQKISDIMSEELTVYDNTEATALGAFIIAAVRLGLFESYEEAFNSSRRKDKKKTYYPDKKQKDFYKELQSVHQSYYKKLMY